MTKATLPDTVGLKLRDMDRRLAAIENRRRTPWMPVPASVYGPGSSYLSTTSTTDVRLFDLSLYVYMPKISTQFWCTADSGTTGQATLYDATSGAVLGSYNFDWNGQYLGLIGPVAHVNATYGGFKAMYLRARVTGGTGKVYLSHSNTWQTPA